MINTGNRSKTNRSVTCDQAVAMIRNDLTTQFFTGK
jgi:hypothetical protein